MQHSRLLLSKLTWPDNILSGFQKTQDHSVEYDDSTEVDLPVCLPPSYIEEEEFKEFEMLLKAEMLTLFIIITICIIICILL